LPAFQLMQVGCCSRSLSGGRSGRLLLLGRRRDFREREHDPGGNGGGQFLERSSILRGLGYAFDRQHVAADGDTPFRQMRDCLCREIEARRERVWRTAGNFEAGNIRVGHASQFGKRSLVGHETMKLNDFATPLYLRRKPEIGDGRRRQRDDRAGIVGRRYLLSLNAGGHDGHSGKQHTHKNSGRQTPHHIPHHSIRGAKLTLESGEGNSQTRELPASTAAIS